MVVVAVVSGVGRLRFLEEEEEEEEEVPSFAAFAALILARRSFLDRVALFDMLNECVCAHQRQIQLEMDW